MYGLVPFMEIQITPVNFNIEGNIKIGKEKATRNQS